MNSRLTDLITVFIVQLVLTLPFYTASVYGLTISNVRVTKVTSNSATVEWNTDNVSDGKLKYGKTAALGFTQRHDNFVSSHSLVLSAGIESSTPYLFSVESTDQSGTASVDNNSNNFYTFKTTDINPPPQVTGLTASATQNGVLLSWDNVNAADFDHYVIYRNRNNIATTTTNSFNDLIAVNADITYKVSAVDKSGNEGAQSDTGGVSMQPGESAPPIISSVDDLQLSDSSAKITWNTDKNSTSVVFYGINKTDNSKESKEFATNHSIIIESLAKNQKYIYTVKSCTSSSACTNSSGHSFDATGRDTTIPFLKLSIPRYVNRKFIDINGSTKSFTQVNLFVNDMNVPKRSLSFKEVGATGKIFFSQVQLEQSNLIKVAIVDKFGNQNEKSFEVGVDTEPPVVKLNKIANLTSKTNFTMSGNANEPVVIRVFIEGNLNLSAPNSASEISPVTDLTAAKIGKNSVELHWNESKDKSFSHYVVYRADVGAIATTSPSNFNLYIDALVDSGKSYTYQVSAVDTFNKESAKSASITVTTLAGGSTLGIKPSSVDIFEAKESKKPDLTTNASGNFNIGIRLNKGDGPYVIKLIFEDKAGNSVTFERAVTLDTVKPTVKIISPPSGALIFENVANEVDVVGKTKPNSRVHLFVDRTPFGSFGKSVEVSGLTNEIQNVAESQLESRCKLEIASRHFCTGADRSVTADSDGNFKFESVDLTVLFGGAARLTEVNASDLRDRPLNQESKDSRKVNLLVIATDQLNQRGAATQTVNIGTCWSGNQSWDIIPLTEAQSPTLLSPERMAEGTETIYFYFNYSYIGAGKGARIVSVSLARACGTRELLDPRFNISCQILQAGASPKYINPPENTLTYFGVPLSRFPGMDQFLQDDWESFLKATNKELTFPFKVTITYQHDQYGDGNLQTETQTTCEQVSYVVDNSLIDPRQVLPDWLLFDFVDFLNDSISVLNDVQEQVDRVLEYVAVGCVASWGLNFAIQVYRRWVTFWDERKYAIKGDKLDALFNTFKFSEDSKTDDECKLLVKTISTKKGGFKLRYVNDIDLKKCFPSSAEAWKREGQVYTLSRWSCDRVFGHSAPSRWTETESDQALLNRIQSGEGCAVDQSVRGLPLRPEKCRELVASSFPQLRSDAYGLDDKCFRIDKGQSKSLFKLGKAIGDNLYEIEKVEGLAEIKINYAVKRSDNSYITASPKSCQELCGVTSKQSSRQEVELNGDTIVIAEDPKDKFKRETDAFCTTVDNCRSLNKNQQISDSKTGKVHKIESAYTYGYSVKVKTSDSSETAKPCFYDGSNREAVSDNPAQRRECCCINGKEGGISNYYAPTDTDPITGGQVHESKTVSETGQTVPTAIINYADMKWSYRYWKEKFEAQGMGEELQGEKVGIDPFLIPVATGVHTEYNPNRYIEGRDLPACFGQNNLLYQAFGKQEQVLRVDPFQQHEAAFQCLHIAGISARIQFIKNLMNSLSTCLIQVRTTGRGDGGACKELFSQYLCNSIWQIIRWFVDGCVPLGFGKNYDNEQIGEIADIVRGGFKSVYESAIDSSNQITQEYGNAKLNELLGTGEESIARKICLAAFGYDWELNIQSFVDAAYATPFATLVQPITRSREFLTVNPVTFKPKYEYRASWIINPGCDFDSYNVQLACVGRKQLDKYPNSVNCGAVNAPSVGYTGAVGTSAGYSQCDCINLPDERIGQTVAQGKLKQNVLEDKKAIHTVIEDNFRYDHLKFTLRPDRKIDARNRDKCFPSGYEDGVFYFPLLEKSPKDIVDCRSDPLSGSLTCGPGSTFGSTKGTAEFIDVKINDKNFYSSNELRFNEGDSLNVVAQIRKVGTAKCMRATFDDEAQIVPIDLDGTNQYNIQFQKPLTIGTKSEIESPTGTRVEKINLNNVKDITINVVFYDINSDKAITFNDDLIKVNNQPIGSSRLNSGETIEVQGKDSIVEVSYVNGKLILKNQGAEIAIAEAILPKSQTGNVPTANIDGKDVAYVGGVITIRVPSQYTQTSQSVPKNLKLELFNVKNQDEGYTGVASCDLNSPVYGANNNPQKRETTIRVETKPSESSPTQGPVIRLINKPDKLKRNENALISAAITHASGISFAQIDCVKPDGNPIITITGNPKPNNVYEFIIDSSYLDVAGKYKCILAATPVSEKATKNNQPINFEVYCGGENNEYGLCDNNGECKTGTKTISGGLQCPQILLGLST